MTQITPSNPTPYPNINAILESFVRGANAIFTDDLVGVYLFGSLSYGDFNPASSDIDLVVILKHPISPEQLEAVQALHQRVAAMDETWAKRLECSYTPLDMLTSILPPEMPRPYIGEGHFYPEAQYGNEWIINLYLLYHHGITLYGQPFQRLVSSVDIQEVQRAAIRDLFREWEPKITEPEWLDNPHYQSYLVLNLCRILYTVLQASTGSKKTSARWVKNEYPQWRDLIETAEVWHYGLDMHCRDETIAFIQFAIDQVNQSPLYPTES